MLDLMVIEFIEWYFLDEKGTLVQQRDCFEVLFAEPLKTMCSMLNATHVQKSKVSSLGERWYWKLQYKYKVGHYDRYKWTYNI